MKGVWGGRGGGGGGGGGGGRREFSGYKFYFGVHCYPFPCLGSVNLLEGLPDDLVSADLRMEGDGSTEQASSSTTLQQQQQQQQNTPPVPSDNPRHAIPVPNSNAAFNQGPPFPISQPRSSISSPGDPTPTMPCVSSTPTHNVASSAGHSMQGLPLQMMPMSSSVSPNQQQQMANYFMPISQFASSGMMTLPYPGMGHMGRPLPLNMPQQLRPTSHGVMTGPLRMGMPNQHAMMAPNMSHHGGMVHPGVGVGVVVPHQNMVRGVRGQMQIGPHQHPAGHPAMHGHHMATGGVPNQLQVGRPNMGRHMIPRGRPLHAQPNVMGQRLSVMGVPRPHVPWGGVPNNVQWGDSQWGDSQHLSGDTIQPRLHGGADPMMSGDTIQPCLHGGADPMTSGDTIQPRLHGGADPMTSGDTIQPRLHGGADPMTSGDTIQPRLHGGADFMTSGDTIQPRLHGGADPMTRPDHGFCGVGGASQVQLPPLPPHTDVWGLGLKGVPPTAPVANSTASMDCTLPGNLQCLIIIISGSASTLTTQQCSRLTIGIIFRSRISAASKLFAPNFRPKFCTGILHAQWTLHKLLHSN